MKKALFIVALVTLICLTVWVGLSSAAGQPKPFQPTHHAIISGDVNGERDVRYRRNDIVHADPLYDDMPFTLGENWTGVGGGSCPVTEGTAYFRIAFLDDIPELALYWQDTEYSYQVLGNGTFTSSRQEKTFEFVASGSYELARRPRGVIGGEYAAVCTLSNPNITVEGVPLP